LRGALATKQCTPQQAALWIASRSLSSGAHSGDPQRRKRNFTCDQSTRRANHQKSVHPLAQKYFASPFGRNNFIDSSRPASSEGRIAIVTDVGRDAVDAGGARDERAHFADGEVVWFL